MFPGPIDDSLDVTVHGGWGSRGRRGRATRLFAEWTDIVGEAMAEHVQPVRIDALSLVVPASSPAWATNQRLGCGDTLLDPPAVHAG